jgi:uncharacterized LabA/DUF88 family protein
MLWQPVALYSAATGFTANNQVDTMTSPEPDSVHISQSVAILVDGNNIERSIHSETNKPNTMLNFDTLVPKLLGNRGLNRLVYFREGKQISSKLKERLHSNYHGSVRPCHKSADIPLSIKATQLASKVDTIIIMSGDSDFVELVSHLKAEGVRVEIASVPSTTSRMLTEEADYVHEITSDDWFTLETKKKTGRKKSQQNKKQEQSQPIRVDTQGPGLDNVSIGSRPVQDTQP